MRIKVLSITCLAVVVSLLSSPIINFCQAQAAPISQKLKGQPGQKVNLFPVRPVGSAPVPPASSLRIENGRFFSYALPPGWHVGEDGQYALTLAAPDNKAFTVMVGNAGLPVNYPPGQFIYEKLSALQPENLQLGQPQQAAPIAGFTYAYQFDVTYSIRGVACRGTVKCHVFPVYDTAVMAMSAALSEASQWPGYASWLPLVAEQISATNGAAFGRRGIMAQNLKNSSAYAEAARQYRDWSQKTWQQATDDRNASQDRKAFQVRENLGAVQTYSNPFGESTKVQLPTIYKYYWVDNQGNYLGSDDPSVNPNSGSTTEWKQMPLSQP
ncbi:MAG: hypothetical protein PHU23_11910 [Dehalococcoidales bacterium]|nr:hypothetical protein [Dehalococcoidales bacterium]